MYDRKTMLTEIIYKNPGIHFCEIIRKSGIKNGTLSHYIDKLESTGIIKVEREKKKTLLEKLLQAKELIIEKQNLELE